MHPSKLNKRIKIMRYLKQSDGAGGYLDNWKTEEGWQVVTNTWGQIRPLRGREFDQAQQSQSEVTHKIVLRYRKDIDKSMIIVHESRRFNIDYILDIDERKRYLELQCVELI